MPGFIATLVVVSTHPGKDGSLQTDVIHSRFGPAKGPGISEHPSRCLCWIYAVVKAAVCADQQQQQQQQQQHTGPRWSYLQDRMGNREGSLRRRMALDDGIQSKRGRAHRNRTASIPKQPPLRDMQKTAE
ncbi:hypothetical protein H4S06_002456 [Coemansia sp. BCRC 34490]|nr:hypothetical protein H4S06_002456 [Coemansia sp. BCRC 34490]